MTVELSDGVTFPEEWDMIARQIYSDCSRVVLTPMSGGYMATTFRAES